jgi:hypothetical protein
MTNSCTAQVDAPRAGTEMALREAAANIFSLRLVLHMFTDSVSALSLSRGHGVQVVRKTGFS